MFESVFDIVLPPLHRRTPELAGLEGWLAQCALLLRLDQYAASRRWLANKDTARGRIGCAEVSKAYARLNGKPATREEGRMLAHLLYGGIVEAHQSSSIDSLIASVLVASLARRETVHLACAQSQRTRAEAIIARANIVQSDYLFLDAGPVARPQKFNTPRVIIGTADALTLHVLKVEALSGVIDFKSTRLIALDIHQHFLREGHREVSLQKVVQRPELIVRTHTAVQLSQNFLLEEHFTRSQSGEVALNSAGRDELETLIADHDDWWAGARRRVDLVEMVLCAMHSLEVGVHYVIEHGSVILKNEELPESFKTAVGDIDLTLVLHRLHGLSPPAFKVVAAQSTLLRVARRYAHVSGVVAPGTMANKDTRRLLGLSVMRGQPIPEVALAACVCSDKKELIGCLLAYLQKFPNTLIIVKSEEELEFISQRLTESGQAFGRLSADISEVAHSWLGLVAELMPESPIVNVNRGYRRILLIGGPSTALERRTLRGHLSRNHIKIFDMLVEDHEVLKQVGRNTVSKWIFVRLPAFLQTYWLKRTLCGLENLERSSRIGLLRNEVLSRSHYAFLGEN